MRLAARIFLGLIGALMLLSILGNIGNEERTGAIVLAAILLLACVGGIVALRSPAGPSSQTSDAWQADQNARLIAAEQQRQRDAVAAQQQAVAAAEQERQRAALAAQQREAEARARWERLCALFGENAQKVLDRQLWRGAPEQAVVEMFGHPHDVSEEVTKKRARRVFKYFPERNTFGLKVTVDDGVVTGWERR